MKSSLRFWLLVAAGLLALAGTMHVLERVAPKAAGAELEIDVDRLRPRLRLDEGTIRIETGLMQISRFNFHPDKSQDEIDAIYSCLEQGILELFGPPDGSGRLVRLDTLELRQNAEQTEERMDRIRARCIPANWYEGPDSPAPPSPIATPGD